VRCREKLSAWQIALAVAAATLSGPAAAQHISVDGRLSPAQTLVGPNYAIGANLGKQVGGNLFHSFGIFGLSTGESATFSGPATVTNVIGRVTGGSQSSINGAVKSTISGANVYLINPAGVVFGPNATVNISGSFHATTADYLKLSDGARFQATNPDGSTLSAAPPAAFGFLNAAPPAITVNGSTLGVSPGRTINLAGGPVSLTGGTVQSNSGTIRVAAVAGPGEVPVDPLNASALTVTSFAPVSLTQGATINVSNGNGVGGSGSVFVNAGALTLDAAKINGLNFGPNAGGPIAINADSISLANGASIANLAFAAGNAGPIAISSNGAVSLDNATIASNTFAGAAAGGVNLQAGSLSITNGGSISSLAFGDGNAGPVTVSAAGTLTLANGRINSNAFAAGNAGSINVTAGSGSFTASGGVASVTLGSGQAGTVAVNIAGALTIDGAGTTPASPSLIVSQTLGAGKAGQVSVSAQSLSVINAGVISTTSFGSGSAGQVTVNAGDILLSNSGVIFSDSFGTGPAGSVNVTAGSLSMTSMGHIASTAQSQGDAGNVAVNVSGALTIDGTGATEMSHSGIFALSLLPNGGAAGQISVSAGTLTLVNPNSDISTTTFGAGAGGRVDVLANSLFIGGGGSIGSLTFGSGNAGQVGVAAGSLTITGGNISTNTFGSGAGGGVNVAATGDVLLTGADASIAAASGGAGDAGSIRLSAANLTLKNGASITTQAATANGGNISLRVGDFLHLVDSRITTSVNGSAGNGGNILIDAQLVVLDHSDIIAQAVAGHGGNITIDANDFIASNDSLVSASSQLGISGTIDVVGPRVDLNGSLVVLPSDLRGAAEVARTSCDARARKQSSLVDAGHGGLPQDTASAIPALYIVNRDLRLDLSPSAGRKADNGGWLPPLPPMARLTMGCG
jgi:filamentous hemagglutinin family protein